MNYHGLTREKKDGIKPIITELRKQLYGTTNNVALLKEGLVINFGKGTEARHTVKIQIIDGLAL